MDDWPFCMEEDATRCTVNRLILLVLSSRASSFGLLIAIQVQKFKLHTTCSIEVGWHWLLAPPDWEPFCFGYASGHALGDSKSKGPLIWREDRNDVPQLNVGTWVEVEERVPPNSQVPTGWRLCQLNPTHQRSDLRSQYSVLSAAADSNAHQQEFFFFSEKLIAELISSRFNKKIF